MKDTELFCMKYTEQFCILSRGWENMSIIGDIYRCIFSLREGYPSIPLLLKISLRDIVEYRTVLFNSECRLLTVKGGKK
jgi:hypothetical protein